MKILFIVIFVLLSDVRCEDADKGTDNYSYGKEIEITNNNFNNEGDYENYLKNYHAGIGYEEQFNTNKVVPSLHGNIMAIPKAQSIQLYKNIPSLHQSPQATSFDYNRYLKTPNYLSFKPYTLSVQILEYVPVKQNIATYSSSNGSSPRMSYISHQMTARKDPKEFVASPQIYGNELGTTGFKITGYKPNNFGQNQYTSTSIGKYTNMPSHWSLTNNGMVSGFGLNMNKYEPIKSHGPVANQYVMPAMKDYSFGKYGAYDTSHHTGKTMSYQTANRGIGFKYTNLPSEYLNSSYKSNIMGAQNNAVGLGYYQTKLPQINTHGKKQYMQVAPKEYNSYSSGSNGNNGQYIENYFQYKPNIASGYNVGYASKLENSPSFQNNLRNIVNMLNKEQRNSNEKAVFVIGKPQFPVNFDTNLGASGTLAGKLSYNNNANIFHGYKY